MGYEANPTSATKDQRLTENEKHLSTEHLLIGLKSRTVSSGVVTAMSQGVIFALTMGSTVVLARLLTPQDFGLVAMVLTVIGFLRNFKNAGLSAATVQGAKVTHAQVSNLFWLNVALGLAAATLIAAGSPAVAWFYHDARLTKITLTLALTFLFESLAVQNMALLNRQMRFKTIATVQIGSTGAGVVVGIGMALMDCGYWALVVSQLAVPVVTFILSWTMCSWRPAFPRKNSGTRPLVRFGARLTASSFIYSLVGGVDSLLIGRQYGPTTVGLYTRAGALLRRPMEQLLAPINAVFIPVLARIQDQPERYRRTFIQLFNALALFSFLFSGLCMALARPLTLVVLGPTWSDAAIIFAGFTFAALFTPLAATCSWLFESQGRGGDALTTSAISSTLSLCAFIVGLPYGAAGVALAWALSCIFLQLPLFFYIAGRSGPIRSSDLWIGFLQHLPIWLTVCGATFWVKHLVSGYSPLQQVLTCGPIGLCAGLAFIFVFRPTRHTAFAILDAARSITSKRAQLN